MQYSDKGVRFVLTSPETESTEQGFSPWKQMVYASVPAKFARRWMYAGRLNTESYPDGSAVTMPCGIRIVEQILREHYPAEDVVVCHPEMLDRFVGPNTKVVAIAAHNPIGVAFSTGVYSNIFGSTAEPINAYESMRVFRHPAIRKHRPKVIVGGAGAWQIEKTDAFERLGVDCVVNGRAETVILDLLAKAERGETLPRSIIPPEPSIDQIRVPKRRTTFGVVEMTRGCGRQCSFCSPTLETRVSVPKDEILEAVRANVREGGRCIFPVSEDIFIYGAKQPFYVPNADAILDLYDSIAAVPGVEFLPLSHCTIAPALVNPDLIKDLSRILLGRNKSVLRNPASTHPEKRFLSPLIGIETGSVRLAAQVMSGKSLPYDVRDWQEIVVQGIEILNRNNWFPVCTFIVGLPGETDDDMRESLRLLERLRKFKILYVPSIFTPLEDTRLAEGKTLKLREMTQLQWEFVLTAWRRSLDFAVVRKQSNLAWKLGMMGFYYTRGKWIHGPQFKYPAFRFAGISEERIGRHLYLGNNGDGSQIPTYPPRLIAKHQEKPLDLFQIAR